MCDNLLSFMRDNPLSDPILQELQKVLGSAESTARWIRSMRSTLSSRSVSVLVSKAGGFEQAVTWLKQTAQLIPKESKGIERFHVRVRDANSDKLRKTTISLDHELYRALIDKTGSGAAASAWIQATTKSLEAGNGSLSRALQAEIVRFVAQPPSTAA